MNTFELKFFTKKTSPSEIPEGSGPMLVYQEIWIDGQQLEEQHPVDLRKLVASLAAPGEFDIFTCGCGNAICGGIYDGILVRHEPGVVRWRIRRPISYRNPDIPVAEDEYDHWQKTASWVEYYFDRKQMIENIAATLDAMREQTPVDADYSPYGFDRKGLDKLDAYQRPLDWQDEPGHRRLYFLADETNPLFLEGQFVSFDELGMSKQFAADFLTWGRESKNASPPPNYRIEWLEKTRSLILSAYQEGLPDDIDIWLAAYKWTVNDELDPWDTGSRLISRQFLNEHPAFEDPYLCLSADKGEFTLWFDFTPEAKDQRYRFVGHGNRIYDDCPFKIPFALEKALSNWACSMPGYKTPGPWNRWLLGRPEPSVQLGNFDWATFHAEGQRLASEIKVLVGNALTVFYEVPWVSPSIGQARRIEIGRIIEEPRS